MTHSPTCTGCPHCSTELRALLSATPEQHCAWLTTQDARQRPRAAARALSAPAGCAPPDPYLRPAAALRAADATAGQRFEDAYKSDRLADLAAEHDRHAAALAARPTARLSAAELASFAPPDGYTLALQKERGR